MPMVAVTVNLPVEARRRTMAAIPRLSSTATAQSDAEPGTCIRLIGYSDTVRTTYRKAYWLILIRCEPHLPSNNNCINFTQSCRQFL